MRVLIRHSRGVDHDAVGGCGPHPDYSAELVHHPADRHRVAVVHRAVRHPLADHPSCVLPPGTRTNRRPQGAVAGLARSQGVTALRTPGSSDTVQP